MGRRGAGIRNGHGDAWRIERLDAATVDRLARRHVPSERAIALGVDVVGDPHREDDDGDVWATLSESRAIADVVPGSAVVLGSSIGRYLGRVVAWDFEVCDDDPILVIELLPVRPSEVERLLGRASTGKLRCGRSAPLHRRHRWN